MSNDFFGGVLDPIRHIGDDVSSFLGVSSSQLGTGLAKAIGGGYDTGNSVNKLSEIDRLNNRYVEPTTKQYKGAQADDNKFKEAKPESFEAVEGSWLQRLRKFSQIDAELQVGKVNEGKDQ